MSENQEEVKKGWSWLGLFFAPYYYAGYGELKKGIIYGSLIAIPFIGIITSIVIGILSGKNARKDLPIGKQKFKWVNVAITFAVMATVSIILQFAVEYFQKNVSNSAFSQEEQNDTVKIKLNTSDPVSIESYEDGVITVSLKGNGAYCTINFTDKEVEDDIISTTCIRFRDKQIFCTKNNEICKTENQISNEINKQFSDARQAIHEDTERY